MKLRQENEPFVVAEITKTDLHQAGIDQTLIDALTEGEMQDIADTMGDLYLENGYWEDIVTAFHRLQEAKHLGETDA